MTPWRSREYLDLSYICDKTCVRCGRFGCEPCHYSGMYADQLGKGGAQKALDVPADLCRICHVYFDEYRGGNDDARAAEFLLCILKTLHRNLQNGYAELRAVVGIRDEAKTLSDDATRPSRARVQKKKRGSQCTASSKTLPRNWTRESAEGTN